MTLTWMWGGRVAHAQAVAWMEAHRDAMIADPGLGGRVLLCTHPPTITLGKNADESHVLGDRAELERAGITVRRTTRGGDVTLHDPGQLMVYPVVRLRSVRRFLANVAQAIIEVAASYGAVGASWREDPAGIWLGERKLAACGVHIHRGVSIHGFAFNLRSPGPNWQWVVPCGLGRERGPIGLADVSPSAPPDAEVAASLGPALARALDEQAVQGHWREATEAVWSQPS